MNIIHTIVFGIMFIAITGCTSALVQNQSHGRAKPGDVAKAAAIDAVTLPVQLLALPVVAIANSKNKEKRKKSEEQRLTETKLINSMIEKLVTNPELIIDKSYLQKETSSLEYKALYRFLVKHRGTKFSEEFYHYIYDNTETKEHENTRIWMLRNIYVPTPILYEAYDKYVTNLYSHKYPYPSPQNYLSILDHPKLPEYLLKFSLNHKLEGIRDKANLVLKRKAENNGSIE